MSNFEEKFKNWQERMSQKSEKEKHVYAMTVAVVITGIVFFFIASNWYFQISGNNLNSTLFTDLEESFTNQTKSFSEEWGNFRMESKKLIDN
jgi:flagellar biosynthesis/type III secretory pathway M-ring protein FliF/YscJ